MFDLTRRPRLLKFLALCDRVKGLVQRGHGDWRTAGRNLSAFYERVWREAAEEVGAAIEDLGCGVFEIRLGDVRTRVMQNSTALDDLATHCVVRTKPVIYGLLNRHGLPTPRYRVFGFEDMRPAVEFLEGIEGDCVVKPGSGTGGGTGVATGVRTRWQLARAAYAASLHSGEILIEQQVEGDNYRLLYLDGKLLDVVQRRPPCVVGDGRSSLLRLIRAANEARAKEGQRLSHALLTLDMDVNRTLAKQGYSLSSVPPAGAAVAVKTAINENGGADNVTARDLVCDALVEEAARAVEIAGVRLAGVDVITRDPGASLRESGGVILEVNTPPGYYWHYHKQDGAFPLAVHVLNRLLAPSPAGELCPS